MPDIFERASRLNLRFETPAGLATVEDLWTLPLENGPGKPKANLDDIARASFNKLKSSENVSFVHPGKAEDTTEQLRLDIVKYVIEVRQKESADAAAITARKAQKQRLLEILADKEEENVRSLSPEEIRKMINELQ